jgi:superfamily II DNA or RNA helicase
VRELKLLPHQMREVEFLRSHPRALLLSETGTGKTASMLARASDFLATGGRVLWVTKTGLTRQLRSEAAAWLPPSLPQPVEVDRAKDRDHFLFTTHGTVARRAEALSGLTADLLIVDEADEVKAGGRDPRAKTYLGLRGLAHQSGAVVFATATPVSTAHALDLWALMDAAGLGGLPSRDFIERHVIHAALPTKWGGTTRVPTGISEYGLGLLLRPLADSSIRTTGDQTGQGLPSMRRVYIDVPLSRSSQDAYDAASQRQGLTGHHSRQQASRSVETLVPAAHEYLTRGDGFNHDKVIVFTENFDLFRPLASALTDSGETVLELKGGMTDRQRAETLERHKAGGRSILVGTSTIETGLNLQHCSLLVTVTPSWSPARERQREGRLVRVGSIHDDVVHVTVRPAVELEDHKARRRQTKDHLAARILDVVPTTADLEVEVFQHV